MCDQVKLKVRNISKKINSLDILENISFEVKNKEFLTLLGPSGCGKSTLLKIISGLESPNEGEVFVDSEDSTQKTGLVSYMHQKDLLLPWKSVIENTIVPLILQGIPKQHAIEIALPIITDFGLKGFENYYPSQLSGGMRQRVSLLRTYMHRNDIMLLDEPFGALDAITRERLQLWLMDISERLKTTILLVTHDINEALMLSDKILILSKRPGKIINEINVPWPHPRTKNLFLTPEYIDLNLKIKNNLMGA